MAGEFLGTLGHSHADTGTSNVSRPGSVSRKPGFVAVISTCSAQKLALQKGVKLWHITP